jgi:sugar phosphate permease
MDRKPIFHFAWIVLAICFANFFVSYSIRLGYGIMLPQMSETLSLTKAQGGLIYSFFFFVYLFFSPLFGNLTDRMGARKVIGFFSIFCAIGATLMGVISGFWSGAFFFGLTGLGASAVYSPTISVVQAWFGGRRRGIALGILQMGSALGMGLMGILLPILVSVSGWRFSWYLLGGSMFVLVLMNGLCLRSDPRELGLFPWGSDMGWVSPGKGGRDIPYREIFRLRLFWIIGISYLFTSAAFYAIFTFIVMYGVTEIGISHTLASSFITVMAFAGLLGAPIILHVSDHFGRRKSILLCHLFIFLSALGLVLSKESILGLMISVSVLGFFFHPVWPLYAACARDYFREDVTGTIVGLWTVFYGIGGIIAPAIAGYLADKTSTFVYSFSFATILVFISSFFMILAKGKNLSIPCEENIRGGGMS